jgi:hypothetical protein
MSKHNNIVINCRFKSRNRNEEPCSTPTSFLEQLSSIDQNNLILTLFITRTEITPTSLLLYKTYFFIDSIKLNTQKLSHIIYQVQIFLSETFLLMNENIHK